MGEDPNDDNPKPRFAPPERVDYSDFAAGRVFRGLPGHPAFPVRLADEIFQRVLALFQDRGGRPPVTLYDPLCGGAYLLATLGYLHWPSLKRLVGSDLDPDALALAARNLGLLGAAGLAERVAQLNTLQSLYGKESHAEALTSARRFQERRAFLARSHSIETTLFQADATNPGDLELNLGSASVDLVITDVPYGRSSTWLDGTAGTIEPAGQIDRLLTALLPLLSPGAVVAVASDKGQRPGHASYQRLGKIQVGIRRVVFLGL
ncbi:MAG TPA: hypothetical protein VMW65_08935 [Chloroflexota bacterium]|nr:hypothetical protein [Chloroflexota bacterium]